jgi:hypothetical protein
MKSSVFVNSIFCHLTSVWLNLPSVGKEESPAIKPPRKPRQPLPNEVPFIRPGPGAPNIRHVGPSNARHIGPPNVRHVGAPNVRRLGFAGNTC